MRIMPILELRLCTIFGEHEKGANLFIAHSYNWAKVNPGNPLFMETVFCGGTSSFATARSTKKRKFKTYAKKALMTVKDWIRKGNPNVRGHCEALMNTKMAALK